MRNTLAMRQAAMKARLSRRGLQKPRRKKYLDDDYRRVQNFSELPEACRLASRVVENPALKDALLWAADVLWAIDGSDWAKEDATRSALASRIRRNKWMTSI